LISQMELLIKAAYLNFLGLKIILELVAFALFYEWQEITNSKYHKGMSIFLLLIIIASVMRSLIESAWQLQITLPYLIAQAIETTGWALFVYILYKEE
jgi:Na+-transporting methylmalonyl-CoA/oxaloacetate decarboxylase gamma subunit